ncbi:MAG: tRNA (cytidine(34)-2'-O)-methyltransferase [Verrucomicrobia bacterium]|nr:tRNA (cytidine(34)-2'-O)-methyltransferase [Verrucomicrobiota bacterium]MCF7709327.1 tRNA (cytidine(34)-2'-O)-methyltransferase [Verrucomicrobiota bacterium]
MNEANLSIILVEPEIPPNTGNIARLCAATKTTLHLIQPLGFSLDDKTLKRAGMDYWSDVKWKLWPDWVSFQNNIPQGARLWLVESNGPRRYSDVKYRAGDYIVLGRETAGLPKGLLEAFNETWVRIPMFNKSSRSLNLSSCAAIVLFEALRQLGFENECT